LPVLIYSKHPTKLVLRGKTDESSVPPIDFAKFVFLPFVNNHFGIDCGIEVHRRGVSSLGQGEIAVTVNPLALSPESISLLDRGNILSFTAVYWKSNDDHHKVDTFLKIPLNV
jgi:RNA 3'-terminal phosphate cyclase (ATP)